MKMENFNIPYVDERVHGRNGWLHLKRANLEKGFHPELVNVEARGDSVRGAFNTPQLLMLSDIGSRHSSSNTTSRS